VSVPAPGQRFFYPVYRILYGFVAFCVECNRHTTHGTRAFEDGGVQYEARVCDVCNTVHAVGKL
jgi:hypothetical protein